MASTYEITRVWGIPIRVHITLILFLPFLVAQLSGAGLGFFSALMGVGLLFGSVALHELGHSYAANRFGYRVRQILLLPIGGVAVLEQLPRKPGEELIIAIAGPAVSLALALLSYPLFSFFRLLGIPSFAVLCILLGWVNGMLFLFNLIPSFPMDGGRIFRALMTPRVGRVRATYLAMRIGRFLAMMMGVIGLFGLPGIVRPFNFMLMLIAGFVYFAAGSEYRSILFQEQMGQMQGFFTQPPPPPEKDPGFTVSPPPYARKHPMERFRRWFDDLFEDIERR